MNKHGYTGVRKRTDTNRSKPYYARLSIACDQFVYSKSFATAQEAAEAYAELKTTHQLRTSKCRLPVPPLADLNLVSSSKEPMENQLTQAAATASCSTLAEQIPTRWLRRKHTRTVFAPATFNSRTT